jgi:4-carboxymuconolactone decarboxylase
MADEDARLKAGLKTLHDLGWPDTGGAPAPGRDEELWQHSLTHLFGELWARPGLSLRDRELVTLGVLIAMDTDGITPHFKHACKLGFTEREIREVIMQAMYYAGWPRGPAAMRRFLNAKNAPDSSWHDVADQN